MRAAAQHALHSARWACSSTDLDRAGLTAKRSARRRSTNPTPYGRTLTTVRKSFNQDKLALDVYRHAEATGQPISVR